MSTTQSDLVFLFDVDNTLVDNDGVQDDMREHLERITACRRATVLGAVRGTARRAGLRGLSGRAGRYRVEELHDPRVLRMANWLVDYPFAKRLYPGALDAVRQRRNGGRR